MIRMMLLNKLPPWHVIDVCFPLGDPNVVRVEANEDAVNSL